MRRSGVGKLLIRYTFFILGWLSLSLGVIGIFLPLVPTTPFLILAAICFNKGSPKFHAWLLNHRWFGPPIRDWQDRRAIRPLYKSMATLMMLGSLALVLTKTTIPELGQATFAVFIFTMLAFIWTRNSA